MAKSTQSNTFSAPPFLCTAASTTFWASPTFLASEEDETCKPAEHDWAVEHSSRSDEFRCLRALAYVYFPVHVQNSTCEREVGCDFHEKSNSGLETCLILAGSVRGVARLKQ